MASPLSTRPYGWPCQGGLGLACAGFSDALSPNVWAFGCCCCVASALSLYCEAAGCPTRASPACAQDVALFSITCKVLCVSQLCKRSPEACLIQHIDECALDRAQDQPLSSITLRTLTLKTTTLHSISHAATLAEKNGTANTESTSGRQARLVPAPWQTASTKAT